jgi:hypothetical protein
MLEGFGDADKLITRVKSSPIKYPVIKTSRGHMI